MKINITVIFIVGVVIDFADDMKNGSGKLNIINANSEKNQAKIKDMLSRILLWFIKNYFSRRLLSIHAVFS